jgi:PilZ domain
MSETERKHPWQGRTYRRFDLEFPVRIRFQSGTARLEIEGVSKNLSIGGLLVRATLAIPKHASVSFMICLHASDAVRPVHLMGEGEVVRVGSGEDEGIYLLAVRCNEPVVQLEELLRESNDTSLSGGCN